MARPRGRTRPRGPRALCRSPAPSCSPDRPARPGRGSAAVVATGPTFRTRPGSGSGMMPAVAGACIFVSQGHTRRRAGKVSRKQTLDVFSRDRSAGIAVGRGRGRRARSPGCAGVAWVPPNGARNPPAQAHPPDPGLSVAACSRTNAVLDEPRFVLDDRYGPDPTGTGPVSSETRLERRRTGCTQHPHPPDRAFRRSFMSINDHLWNFGSR